MTGGSGTRLRQAIDATEWTVREFTRRVRPVCEELGICGASYTNVHRSLDDDTPASGPFLRAAASVLGVRPAWLIDGTGAMRSTDPVMDQPVETIANRAKLALQGKGTTLWLYDRMLELGDSDEGPKPSYQQLVRFFGGDADLSDATLADMATVLGVDKQWLVDGGPVLDLGGKPADWLNSQISTTIAGLYGLGQPELVSMFHMCLNNAVAACQAGPTVEEIAELARELKAVLTYPLGRLSGQSDSDGNPKAIPRDKAISYYSSMLLAMLRAMPERASVPDAATLIEQLTSDEPPRLHFDLN